MHISALPYALIVGGLAASATAIGGVLALRFQKRQGLLFGFGSGAIIGVALLDLLPEALSLGTGYRLPLDVLTATAVGFAIYLVLNRVSATLFGHHHGVHQHLGPGSLSAHSLLDGLGIGFGFQVSTRAGVFLSIAVLAHDFLDGANTVTLSLAGGGAMPNARRWLAIDALAPITGIVLSRLFTLPRDALALLLAVFAGGFLYIGASELLPRSRLGETGFPRILATVCGMSFVYLAVKLV